MTTGRGGTLDPIAFISQPIIVQTGATGILLFVVISILRGWLVPRAVMVDRIKDKDAEIGRLTAALSVSEAGRQELLRQNGELIDSSRTFTEFIDRFRQYVDRPAPTTPRQIGGEE